jgi:hypothetical protein
MGHDHHFIDGVTEPIPDKHFRANTSGQLLGGSSRASGDTSDPWKQSRIRRACDMKLKKKP